MMTGASPPGPLRCGSAPCRVNAVAAAASKALPPRSSTAMPTWLAIQCVVATTPKVPAISGRVVNIGSSWSGVSCSLGQRNALGEHEGRIRAPLDEHADVLHASRQGEQIGEIRLRRGAVERVLRRREPPCQRQVEEPFAKDVGIPPAPQVRL